MKIKFFFLLLLVSTLRTWAQTIVSPTYSRRDNISLRINEVERTTQYTVIKGVYENVMHYGWACINSTIYLRDSKSGKNIGTIIKSEGLPVSLPNTSLLKKMKAFLLNSISQLFQMTSTWLT